VDDRIAIGEGAVGDTVDDGRGDELVGLAPVVGRLDRGAGGWRVMSGLAMDDRVIAPFGPVPALVAIHREVAPPDGRDPGIGVRRGETGLEVGDEAERRARRRVATIEQRMDANGADTLPGGQLGERDEVTVVGMDAARADEPDHVERTAPFASSLAGRD
jgi:hypothetical protein